MELVYGKGLLLVLAFIVVEILILHFIKKEKLPWKEMVLNANSGHILLLIFRGVTLIVYAYVSGTFGWAGFKELPEIWQWIITAISWDFAYYWSHRSHHEIPFLWRIHSIHHQGEHFSLSLGIRNSWFQNLTSAPFFLPLAFLGVPTELFLAVAAVHLFVQFYNHNGIVNKSGILEKFMITPSHHRVHHGSNPEYIDKNHGGTFVIWDKIFGTFKEEDPKIAIRYGTVEKIHTQHPFWANMLPLFQFFGFGRKGSKGANKFYAYTDAYIWSGAVLLFLLLVYYVNVEPVWTGMRELALFSSIFFGTLALGGIADGSRGGMVSWIGIWLMCPILFPLLLHIQGGWMLWLIPLMLAHASWGLRLLVKTEAQHKKEIALKIA
ncbi:MAG: sterol desaturase family protein [Bacteroidota bacterium]